MALYDAAQAYALAFSYRDIAAEVDAVLGWAAPVLGRPVRSVLELAAGPADHARDLVGRGLRATALDINPAMTELALAAGAANGQRLRAVTADMCAFTLDEQFDVAIMMIDSIAHILDDATLRSHFMCVAAHLTGGGCYVVELSHPADSIADQSLTTSAWTQAGDGESVSIRWGEPDDPTDAASGVTSVTVTMEHVRDGRDPVVINDVVAQHAWLQDDLMAAMDGYFAPIAWYGSFDGVGLDNASAWRMIAVLQKSARNG
ncbi:MAG: class I SAM-dependent methyltransferase [Frankiaceae bacterium]|nr:class I SAM-dependent methyltransferase [Frankiaceae bacterium]MBV9872157.1 class I SAM-dependent methyltransferase [Frankiaceae bacterium]